MDELIKALPSLLGVVVGGLITFFIQQATIRKQQEWDRKKMELDTHNKNEARKFEVFSQILHAHAKHIVLEYSMHGPPQLNEVKYSKYIRPLLYEIYHLLDYTIVGKIEKIEHIHEKQFAMEVDEDGDIEIVTENYEEIIKIIKQDFNSLRKSRNHREP
ncbi:MULTISPECIES: hypothetical protein [Bacillus cereus group]|uniref:hypothetical protein n=1 Tax=Bacillus cereus group TaxID=86661 RepID=UPI00027BEC5B|nr:MULTISPECIES: hypothetical protein [Bacillus cereus group]EJV49972.1 hypothetical protein IEA_01341 [Bacillus toyonensis]EOP38964.1 hypothetical protein IKI_03485 [Bacillus toyonensis]MBE7135933.1 hypothetical protein [Bacillus toyonensis]MBE7164983.1 hypothetical protein [Bacillus toyonensis]PEB31766.1 hypothetical protein COO14_01715 [Bacillus toyonensis]